MKKRSAILCAIALVAAFACTKETNKIDEKNETSLEAVTEVVGASLDNDTKATVATADGIFNWTEAVDYVAFYNGTTFVKSNAAAATGTSTTFTITYTGTRSDYAYFPYYLVQNPATAVDGESMTTENTTQVALPSTYALTAISGENTPCPMVATNTPGSGWEFHQLCGLFRLTVNNIPSTATGLLVDFHGHKVHGTFDVTGADTATPSIATSVDNTNDQITVTFDPGITSATLNLPLPVGDYNDVSITPIGSSTKVSSTRHIKAGGYTAARARGKKLTATLVSFTINDSGDKVVFAPGNLQAVIGSYDGDTHIATASSWHFADYQKSVVASSSLTPSNTVDKFRWVGRSASYDTYGLIDIEYSGETTAYFGHSANESLKSDWGTVQIDSYESGDWETPSSEWLSYVFKSRTVTNTLHEGARFCSAKVAGIRGIILFPDNYIHPLDADFYIPSNPENVHWNTTDNYFMSASTDCWIKMEDAGAIFFPVTTTDNSDPGCYWTSTKDPSLASHAYACRFYFWGLSPAQVRMDSANCVRLVRTLG